MLACECSISLFLLTVKPSLFLSLYSEKNPEKKEKSCSCQEKQKQHNMLFSACTLVTLSSLSCWFFRVVVVVFFSPNLKTQNVGKNYNFNKRTLLHPPNYKSSCDHYIHNTLLSHHVMLPQILIVQDTSRTGKHNWSNHSFGPHWCPSLTIVTVLKTRTAFRCWKVNFPQPANIRNSKNV